MKNTKKYNIKMIARKSISYLFILLASLILVSCSGGGSSNGGSSNDNDPDDIDIQQECSDEFGDASRCEIREGL